MQQIQKYLHILIQGWWIIALTTLSALNLALISSYTATPLYRTTARFIVIPDPSLSATSEDRDILRTIEALDKRSIVATYAEVMSAPRFYEEAVNTALQLNPKELGTYKVRSVVLPDTSAIELSVEGPDPEIAALLANTVGQRAIAYIKDIQVIYDISLLEPAEPPRNPFSPTPARDAGVAVVLGLVFGALLAILREQLGHLLPMLGIFGTRAETDLVGPSSIYANYRLKGDLQATHIDEFPHEKSLDELPQLFNVILTNDSFQKRLEQELTRSQQGALSLGLIQLDGLQDLVGKSSQSAAIRQHVLNKVTKILYDELPEDVILGHRDNNSFAILLPAISGSVAIHVIGHLQQALAQPMEFDQPGNKATLLSPHAGITEYEGQSASVLINQAELALEWSYQNGKQTVLYSMDKQTQLRNN